MWVSKVNDWHLSHTDLSKYFIERIKQKVDPTEVISNKHKTTNGIVLLREILNVIIIAKTRRKSINRLVSLIDEAKNKLLGSSVVNDLIIQKYHPDLIALLERVTPSNIKESELGYLEHSFSLFYERLRTVYRQNKVDFSLESIFLV